MAIRVETAEHWAGRKVATLPPRWGKRLLDRHARTLKKSKGAERDANIALREMVDGLKTSRLPLDSSDEDICSRAAFLASECKVSAIEFCNRVMYAGGVALSREQIEERHGADWSRSLAVELRFFAMCEGAAVPWEGKKEGMRWGGVARMMCESWWRRKLRARHASLVEGAAIQLGYVNRSRDLYVSNESFERRAQQLRRNAALLEGITMRNELEQEYTLAQLAAVGMANKAIRRGELMARLDGFDRIAQDLGHERIFLTQTAPSRMHKWHTVEGSRAVYENKKYDGTTPREAQQFLTKAFARTRAKLARAGIRFYGFRVCEPHHDGCPHWHSLFFVEPFLTNAEEGESGTPATARRSLVSMELAAPAKGRRAVPRMLAIMRRYLMAGEDDAARKAQALNFKYINADEGSAVGYMAKYISKNIDGYQVGEDFCGGQSVDTCKRVEAWAATWGIRQFQQIGGAPVGVWRELRRVEAVPEDAPEYLKAAHQACNKDAEKAQKADFAEYVKAQGGAFVGRAARIKIEQEEAGEEGIYGDIVRRVVGVVTEGAREYFIGRFKAVGEFVRWLVRSVRHTWEVVRGSGAQRPWTGVNNCTRGNGVKNEAGGFGGGFDRGGGHYFGKYPPDFAALGASGYQMGGA